MKKWILKSEVEKILSAYSIRKDEFELVSNSGYCYISKYTKGYMITIAEELSGGLSGGEKTGRIIVSHTKGNGKKSYQDIWDRDFNNQLQFCFRNLSNQPLADADYIRDLEKENERLKKEGAKLREELLNLKEQRQKLNDSATGENQNVSEPQTELARPKYNARGAGRKKSQARLETMSKVKQLLEEGFSDKQIQEKVGISSATFYRYKKSIMTN